MAERWVTDASPLIALAKIGQAGLLEELAGEVIVPAAVVGEVLEGPPQDPAPKAARVFADAGELEVHRATGDAAATTGRRVIFYFGSASVGSNR